MKEEKTVMKKNTTILVAAVFSILAFFIFKARIIESQNTLTKNYGEKAPVVVVNKDIMSGGMLDESNLEVKEIPALFVQPGAIKSLEEGLGRVTQIPVKAGEQLLETKLVQGGGGYLSLRLGKGESRRAIALKMDGEGALAGLIRPGDLIDVIGVFESAPDGGDSKLKNHAIVLVQAVRVLAIDDRLSDADYISSASADKNLGRMAENSSSGKSHWLITVDTEASDAWKLSLASQVAHLRCVLRYRTNDKLMNYDMIDPLKLRANMREIKSTELFGASGKTIWPSGQQPASGQSGYSGE